MQKSVASSAEPWAHPTAEVEVGAVVGGATRIWHHSHVRRGAIVGSRCALGKNVFIDAQAVIGDRVKIQNNVSVYSGVELGDEVFVGPSVVFTNDLRPRAASTGWTVTPTVVMRGASIGANATVICGNSIGEYSMVAAGAVVTRSVESHELVVGNPARHHGWVCKCGGVVSHSPDRPERLDCSACTTHATDAREADGL